MKIVSTIDITLTIPPKMRGIFPNEKTLVIELKKDTPKEVPDYVAGFYTHSRPHVFRLASEPKKVEETVEPPKPKDFFNPQEWLNENYDNIEQAIKTLKHPDLMKVGKLLNLPGIHKQTQEHVQERIVADIKVKQNQDEEISKHKGV